MQSYTLTTNGIHTETETSSFQQHDLSLAAPEVIQCVQWQNGPQDNDIAVFCVL